MRFQSSCPKHLQQQLTKGNIINSLYVWPLPLAQHYLNKVKQLSTCNYGFRNFWYCKWNGRLTRIFFHSTLWTSLFLARFVFLEILFQHPTEQHVILGLLKSDCRNLREPRPCFSHVHEKIKVCSKTISKYAITEQRHYIQTHHLPSL